MESEQPTANRFTNLLFRIPLRIRIKRFILTWGDLYIAFPRPTDEVQNSRMTGQKSNAKHAEATRREVW